jgi:hypothetical protein
VQPNKYDLLWPYNFKSVIGHHLLWWIPFYQPEIEGKGFEYLKIDKPTSK